MTGEIVRCPYCMQHFDSEVGRKFAKNKSLRRECLGECGVFK